MKKQMFGFSLLFFSYIITVRGSIGLKWWVLDMLINIFSTDAWILIFGLLGILFCYLGMRGREDRS